MSNFQGRKVIVAGLASTGFSTARALLEEGATVVVTEAKSTAEIEERAAWLRAHGGEVETGGHTVEVLDADLAVVSPGIPPTSEVIERLDAAGIPIISEVELAYRFGSCDLLAVTGTNGKTTTTSLLAAMLERAGVASMAAGNIGVPLIDAVRRVPPDGAIAVEVSSFQLAYIDRFRARVAVLLNVAEDHTDWHGGIEPYAQAKARIFENQLADDHAVLNADDERVMAIGAGARARKVTFSTSRAAEASLDDGYLSWNGTRIVALSDLFLRGRAGWEDCLAAMAAAFSYGLDTESVRGALADFHPLGHRMEIVGTKDAVTYIDDSKATNPHATLAAVAGLQDVVLIAGGRSKGIDLGALAQTVPPVIAVVAIGEAAAQVEQVFDELVSVRTAATMDEATALASEMSVPGGSVLLSPGCASLDMYSSYAERGEAFQSAARHLGVEGEDDGGS